MDNRTIEEKYKDSVECAKLVKKLEENYGLREYWAEGVYYGEYTVEEAIAAQEENDREFESLKESVDTADVKVITSIDDFNKVIESFDNI